MPSKKKNSKTPSKLSNSDACSFDVSSSSTAISSASYCINHDNGDFSSSLAEASSKFPSFVSESAFVGRVMDGSTADTRGAKIWLSESAMISSSITPGSIVSVSLASLDKNSSGFALSVLSDECARSFGFELAGVLANELGDFFALATAYPSSKVIKNEVCLSSTLSHTLGCPDSRTIFVYPLNSKQFTENGNDKILTLADRCFPSKGCEELYLSQVSLKREIQLESAISSSINVSNEDANATVKNDKLLSPRTPHVSMSKLRSPCSSHTYTSSHAKSRSKTNYLSHAPINILDEKELLEDDASRKLLEACASAWLCSRILLPGNIVTIPLLSRQYVFRVVVSKKLSSVYQNQNSKNNGSALDISEANGYALFVDSGTKVHFVLSGNPSIEFPMTNSIARDVNRHGHTQEIMEENLLKLGGLSTEFTVLKDIIISSTVKGTLSSLGLRPAKGVLLHGPPGTGKTTLARLCAYVSGVNLMSVNGPEIISLYQGESEQALHEVFRKASEAVPAVIFIDELDSIVPARKDGGDQLSQRMVATLLNLMDGMSRTDGVLVVAATNRPDSIEPALRRPGRLDREIEIGVPSPGQRHEILLSLLSGMQHSLREEDIQHLAMVTHGFVGADLASLCNEAALIRLRQYVNLTICHDVEKSSDILDIIGSSWPSSLNVDLRVTYEDFEKARCRARPSAMREVILEVPKVSWEDVGGQREVKVQLMEAVEWPQKYKDAFKRIGTRPPTGILLFGPPGCSKTLLARAVASEAGLNFLAVKGPELFSKWVGESEKAVRSLFAKARANAPSIIFFDEIDGLAIIRGKENDGVSVGDRVMSQLLVELDGLQQRGSVTVIAATNRPDKIDPALLRPGRFDRLLYVGPPNQKDREDIFRVHLRQMPCCSDVCISELSLLTEGCTGADISLICRDAAIAAIEENLSASDIKMEHFKTGIKKVEPSDVQIYENLSVRFQRLVHATTTEVDSSRSTLISEQGPIPFWARVRSAAHSIFQFPEFILQRVSSSGSYK